MFFETLKTRKFSVNDLKYIVDPSQTDYKSLLNFKFKGEKKLMLIKDIYKELKEQKVKHRYKITGGLIEIINDNYILSLNYEFYRQSLRRVKKESVLVKYNVNNLIYEYEKLSEMQEMLFKKGSEDYYYIMGITTLYGWVDSATPEKVSEYMKNWVNNDFEPKYNSSTDDFYQRFQSKVNQILRWKATNLEATVNVTEFCENIAYTGTPGSAFDPGGERLELSFDDQRIKVSNSKYAKSGALSTKEKIKRIFKHEKQKCSVSQKIEFFPKFRLILSSDFNMSMRMRFIDTWLTTWMNGNGKSTLFQTKAQTLQMWLDFAKENGWNIPIDQSKFDHKATKRMIMIIVNAIKQLITDRCFGQPKEDLLLAIEAIIYAIDGGDVIFKYKDGTIKFEYKSGLLSGWQWTSFFGTICNIAEMEVAMDMLRENNFDTSVLLFNAQGDDDLLRMTSLRSAVALVCAYRIMGFEVHPKKTFFSLKHNEYLRKYYQNGEVNGYPARMVNNLLWVYPGDRLNISILEKLSSTKSKFEKFVERLKGDKKLLVRYLEHEYRGLKIEKEMYYKYMCTEKIYGGGGLREYVKSSERVEKNFEIVKIGGEIDGTLSIVGKGYDEFRMRFGYLQDRDLQSWYVHAINVPDVYKKIEIREEAIYEAREVTQRIEEKSFEIVKSAEKPNTKLNPMLPKNVVFGQSSEFLEFAFPNIQTFIEHGNAPKSWIYDYLVGKVKIITPEINNMSEEFASLVWGGYSASLVHAMYYKRTFTNKWLSLQKYAFNQFKNIYTTLLTSMPKMF